MPPRRKPTLLAQGKSRTLGGSARPWRVRLYAPEDGGTKYQVMVRAPAADGEPWKRVLRRASSEDEARKIFAQAEAALDSEKETPVGADVRAARTIRMLGEASLKESIEHSRKVMEKGARTIFSTRGREDLRGAMQARLATRLARPVDRPAGRARDRAGERPAWGDGAVRRPTTPTRDPSG